MLFTNIFALAFATLVAAETAEVQHEARDNYAVSTAMTFQDFPVDTRDRPRCTASQTSTATPAVSTEDDATNSAALCK